MTDPGGASVRVTVEEIEVVIDAAWGVGDEGESGVRNIAIAIVTYLAARPVPAATPTAALPASVHIRVRDEAPPEPASPEVGDHVLLEIVASILSGIPGIDRLHAQWFAEEIVLKVRAALQPGPRGREEAKG